MDDILLISGTIFNWATQIFNLYTSTFILSAVLALWVLRKVVSLYRKL